MENQKAVARYSLALLTCAGLVLSGCTAIKLHLRKPGEINETMPGPVAEEYHCEKRELPFFQIEKTELLPERVAGGQELNHRIVYVMCPRHVTEVVKGELDTRILFRGQAIFIESIDQELKPGRWVIDTFIPLPENAEPGVYALQFHFKSSEGELEGRSDFVVERAD